MSFDLGELVCTFGVVAGAAIIYLGLLLFARGPVDSSGRSIRFPRPDERLANAAPASALLVVGGALIFRVVATIPGPWRKPTTPHFPVHVLDLNTPPAAIERARLPS
jgi:hypothetical protein